MIYLNGCEFSYIFLCFIHLLEPIYLLLEELEIDAENKIRGDNLIKDLS